MHYSVRSSFITWLTKKAVLGHAITSKARVNKLYGSVKTLNIAVLVLQHYRNVLR